MMKDFFFTRTKYSRWRTSSIFFKGVYEFEVYEFMSFGGRIMSMRTLSFLEFKLIHFELMDS